MSMWGEVFGSLQTMSVWQLLFAFIACTAYALAQGRLLGGRGQWAALGLAACAAFGFVLEAEHWVDGFMLVAVAVAGLGIFAALVWLTSRMIGMTAVGATPRSPDSLLSLPPADPEGAVGGPGQTITAPRRTAASH